MTRYLTILAIGLVGCASTSSTSRVAEPSGPVIVRVVSRDSTITAHSSGNGTVYSLQNAAGQQTVPAMSLPQLQAQHPQLARKVQALQANNAWAGVE